MFFNNQLFTKVVPDWEDSADLSHCFCKNLMEKKSTKKKIIIVIVDIDRNNSHL